MCWISRPQLRGKGASAEAVTLRDGDRPIGGTYEVYFVGGDASSATVAARASATSVRAALVEGLGLPAATEVARSEPLDDSLAYTWSVTLPRGTSLFGDQSSDLGTLAVNGSGLSGEGAMVNITLARLGTVPLAGKFNISIGGEGWATLPHNATSMEIDDAISSFSTSGGNVTVSQENFQVNTGNDIRTGTQWAVTFAALRAAGDVPLIEVNGSTLTGSGVEVYANETLKGVTADIQQLSIDGYNGTFSVLIEQEGNANVSSTNSSSNSSDPTFLSSVAVPWDASPSEIAAAVYHVTGAQVYVERFPISSDGGGFDWLVLFAEALNGTWGKVQLNSSGLFADDSLLGGSDRKANLTLFRNSSATAIGGGFSMRFGQHCDERAAGVYCSVIRTSQLSFDSSATEVTAALQILPAILDVTVYDNGGSAQWDGVAKIAPDNFGVASAGARFRVTLTRVVFNASDSAVAEYWHRTWSVDEAAIEWSGDLATGGDLPLLDVDVLGMTGSNPRGRVEEVRKGLSTQSGGVVAVEISQNAGRDYTSSSVTYVYEPLVFVDALVPDHGPVHGGTEVRRDKRHWQLQSP